ncbi:hypothetical protein Tco_0406293, partial [Tanacetum coccineum]
MLCPAKSNAPKVVSVEVVWVFMVVTWGQRGGGGSEWVVVMERARGGVWWWVSGRSGDGEAFGTWSEKFSGDGGGGRNPAGGGYQKNWERRR